jgi:Ni,Fe-hydrogenase I small subunit
LTQKRRSSAAWLLAVATALRCNSFGNQLGLNKIVQDLLTSEYHPVLQAAEALRAEETSVVKDWRS